MAPPSALPPASPSRLLDGLFVLTVAHLAARLEWGPASVVALLMGVAHAASASSRAAFLPLHAVALPTAVAAFRADGLHADAPFTLWLRLALVAAIAVSLALDAAMCPLRGVVPPGAGPFDAAMLEVGVPASTGCTARIFYPTRVAVRPRGVPGPARHPYLVHGTDVTDGVASFLGLPSTLFRWLAFTRPWCYEADPEDSPPATPAQGAPRTGFPVLVFSHGLGGTPDVYGALIRDLVSRGNVVVALCHTDGSAAFTRTEDGAALA